MGLSWPIGIARCVPKGNSIRFPYDNYKSSIDPVLSVKIAEYWPRSCFG